MTTTLCTMKSTNLLFSVNNNTQPQCKVTSTSELIDSKALIVRYSSESIRLQLNNLTFKHHPVSQWPDMGVFVIGCCVYRSSK